MADDEGQRIQHEFNEERERLIKDHHGSKAKFDNLSTQEQQDIAHKAALNVQRRRRGERREE